MSNSAAQNSLQCLLEHAPHLLHVVLIVTEIKVYVRVDATELDRRSIVRSASHGSNSKVSSVIEREWKWIQSKILCRTLQLHEQCQIHLYWPGHTISKNTI